MEGKLYDLPSGAKLFVSVSEYERVMALHDALAAELRGNGLGALDVAKIQLALNVERERRAAAAAGKDFVDDGAADAGLNAIVDKLLGILGSKAVKAALFACAEKAVYRGNGEEGSSLRFRVDAPGYAVFDHPKWGVQARGDFYAICKAVAEENLRPFGQALFSMWLDLVGKGADIPKSDSKA